MSLPVVTVATPWTTRFGDIEHSTSTTPTKMEPPYISVLVNPSGTATIENRLLYLYDGLFSVTPVQWTPEEIEYGFVSLTGKPISKVTGWRPSWEITVNLMGRDVRAELLHAIGMMNGVKWTFGSVSATPDRRFLFYPPGDYARVGIPVSIAADKLESEFFGGKYIGYKGSKFTIIGESLYSEMVFPPPVVVHSRATWGSFLTDGCHIYSDPTTVHIP